MEDAGGGSGDSRVMLSFDEKDPSQASMKYLLLNPGGKFEDIVQSCRSVRRQTVGNYPRSKVI